MFNKPPPSPMPSAVLSAIVDELAGPAMVTAGYVLWGMNVMPLGPTSVSKLALSRPQSSLAQCR